ncbi:MAG TPA: DUF2007 domain-containing protein [Solirubrobacterales bacterium]|nr:DUF2007 domain-containing protein [Solirubrobacterales bacterium]
MSDPRFVENVELVKVALVPNPVEAEMVRGLLESEGIPVLLEEAGTSPGAKNGPRLIFGGPQRVMVHAHRADEARALLEAQPEEQTSEP